MTPFDSRTRLNAVIIAMQILAQEVYTVKESQDLLKISSSTMKRLLKRGLIRANKVGGQYRILGRELLRIVSPELEVSVQRSYSSLKKRVIDEVNTW